MAWHAIDIDIVLCNIYSDEDMRMHYIYILHNSLHFIFREKKKEETDHYFPHYDEHAQSPIFFLTKIHTTTNNVQYKVQSFSFSNVFYIYLGFQK